MKIGIAHYSSPSDISGVTTWLVDFCGKLKQAGHQVVMHLHHFGSDPLQSSILPSLHRLGIETYSVPRTRSLEGDTRQTLQFLNQVQPDLFLPQCLHAHFMAAAHAGSHGLPWIFTMHSDDPDYWCVAESLTPERSGGRCVCVSHFLAQQLRKRDPSTNPHVIPCGITLPTAEARFSAKPFRVVYSGRMVERQKCIHQVVHTLIHACRASGQIEAHLIGDGVARPTCEQLVHQADLADRIQFHGRVESQQVQQILLSSQAFLMMSEYEGLPVSLLEAMAAGLVPVVRSIESGIPELVHHERTGLLVANDSVEAALALVRLSCEADLWHRCSRQARSLVHGSYSIDNCFGRWTRLIRQHQGCAIVHFPISTTDLHRSLPLGDHRFHVQYPSRPSPSSRLHPRRLAAALKRRLSQ